MRIRTLKPEFWSHPVLARLSDSARLLAVGLLNFADDEGYFLADPALVRSAIYPFDDDSTRTRRALEELSKIGYIEIVEHPEQGKIGFVTNFRRHQRIDRPTPSKIKVYFGSTNTRRILVERSLLEQGTGNREQGKEQGITEGCSEPSADASASEPPSPKPTDLALEGETVSTQRTVLTIPTNKNGTEWSLTETKLAEYQATYPAIDAKAECLKARQWCIDNKAQRKTLAGMPAFLNRWLARANDYRPTKAPMQPRTANPHHRPATSPTEHASGGGWTEND